MNVNQQQREMKYSYISDNQHDPIFEPRSLKLSKVIFSLSKVGSPIWMYQLNWTCDVNHNLPTQ